MGINDGMPIRRSNDGSPWAGPPLLALLVLAACTENYGTKADSAAPQNREPPIEWNYAVPPPPPPPPEEQRRQAERLVRDACADLGVVLTPGEDGLDASDYNCERPFHAPDL